MANEIIVTFDDSMDIELRTEKYLRGGSTGAQPMTSAGQIVARLLEGVSPEEATGLYLTLPEEFREAMDQVSPSRYLDDIKAKLLVLHDRDEGLVPTAESRRLAAAMADRSGVRYTGLFSSDHVGTTSGSGAWLQIKEGFKLYRHMYGGSGAGT